MYSPLRKGGDSMYMSDWAESWLERENGWAFKVCELAQFNPIEVRRIRTTCTILEIAEAWKTMKALSEFAWNDRDA